METEEITKLVDGIYKNILDKFNPGARQMINAGKAYLKALHGAAAASRMYVDAITKLARQSQQGTWGGSSDIGSALMQIVEVYKEIQAQQMNILKAFYVDLLVPLETNLEKDTKVVQSEQKRFLQQHKQRSETYSKAAATMKKQRKKQRSAAKTGIAMDKELKSMQILEEERSKLDAFCEQSLKNAMTQERRRYGFVLERQCSLAKHYLAYHSAGHSLYQSHLDDWQEIAKTREFLPQSIENMFASKLNQVNFWNEDGGSPSKDDDRVSVNSQLRKTKSMDASCLDVANSPTSPPHVPLTRAKSDFNLTASTHSLAQEIPSSPSRRPKSMAVPDTSTWDTPLARAMYAYLSSGENQLSFLEGDVIALMGERNKGWQFGENLRTQCSGWFPLAYTEPFIDDTATSASSPTHRREEGGAPSNAPRPAPLTKFGDTLLRNNQGGVPPSGPAPTAPRKVPPNPPRLPRQPPPPSASLHSSNDSGFSNDPPPAPEIDYSDDDSNRRKKSGRRGDGKGRESTSVRGWLRQSTDDWYTDNEGGYERPPPIRHSQSNGHLAMTSSRHSTSASHLATLGRMRPSNNDSQDKIHDIQMQLKAIELPYEKKVKRTKSLWKFKRNEEVIEGMSMWKHRSLIDISDEAKQQATPKPMKKPLSLPRPPTEPPKPPISTDTSSSEEDPLDSESCIVVDDHRKKPEDIVSILPRTHLIKKKDTTLSRGGGGGGVGGESDIEMTSRRLEHRKNNAKTIEDSWYSSWDDIKA